MLIYTQSRQGRLIVARYVSESRRAGIRNKCRVRKEKEIFLAPQARGPRRARLWLDGVEIHA
jgi:hypothetical protein